MRKELPVQDLLFLHGLSPGKNYEAFSSDIMDSILDSLFIHNCDLQVFQNHLGSDFRKFTGE